MSFYKELKLLNQFDPELAGMIKKELERQELGLEMIPS